MWFALIVLIPAAGHSTDVSVDDLFRAGNISRIELSPDGRYVAWQQNLNINAGNEDVGYSLIHSFSKNQYVTNVEWTGPDTMIVQTRSRASGDSFMWVTRLGIKENDEFGVIEERRHDVSGYIHDALVHSPNEIVFARWNTDSDFVFAELFRANIFEKKTKRVFGRKTKLDTGSAELDYYVGDANGNLIAGTRVYDGAPELWLRTPGTRNWSMIWKGTEDVGFEIAGLTSDGQTVWALSNAFTDRVAAIEFDLTSRSLNRVLYEHERFDVTGLLTDVESGTPDAVTYENQGLLHYEFFSDRRRAEFDDLQSRFPDNNIAVVGASSDQSVVLVHTSSPSSRGHVFRCPIYGNTCSDIGSVAPWLDDKRLSDTIALQVQSTNDIVVDAYLTLPVAGDDQIPLIAMPHGGPIGISDDRNFSPDVQWLTANGYAVMQVNYRGSGGYGRQFEAAGLRQWGRGIEDDIEASVNYVLENFPQLDADRVGIFGGSYGGYSALMSVIRNPDLFRCAASFAGVTDLTLLFSQSRTRESDSLRDELIRRVGNPFHDYAEQRANSPVYRYKEITRPVFLAHGTADTIVDVEHSWRLRKLMELAGQKPTFLILDDIGHGFEYTNEAEAFYGPLVHFLDKHLKN